MKHRYIMGAVALCFVIGILWPHLFPTAEDKAVVAAKAQPYTPADLQLRNPNTNEVLVLYRVTVRGVPCVVLSHFRGNALSCDWSKP